MKKTPTPWTLIGNNTLISIMKGGFRICSFKRLAHNWDEQRQNAEFVLRAVNSHDDLVETVEALLGEAWRVVNSVCSYEDGHKVFTGTQEIYDNAQLVLEKAKDGTR